MIHKKTFFYEKKSLRSLKLFLRSKIITCQKKSRSKTQAKKLNELTERVSKSKKFLIAKKKSY
jgi:hypothetical protein